MIKLNLIYRTLTMNSFTNLKYLFATYIFLKKTIYLCMQKEQLQLKVILQYKNIKTVIIAFQILQGKSLKLITTKLF